MINVDWKDVKFGITKTVKDNNPLFDVVYAISPDLAFKPIITIELHTLFIALMHKYGATGAMDMITKALENIIEDYESSEITDLTKENKSHD